MDILISNILAILPDTIRVCSVYIRSGIIVGIDEAPPDFVPQKTINGSGFLLMPGLVNAHTHSYMALFRNCADDLKFNDWLFGRIMPLEDKLDEDACYWGTLLAISEMISTGTTAFLDMIMFMDAAARAVSESGIRAVLSRGLSGDCDEMSGGFRRLREAENSINTWAGYDNISFMIGPHAPYTCTENYLRLAAETAKRYDLPITIHLAETLSEIDSVKKDFGCSPIELADRCGLLNERTVAAHCIYLGGKDMDILKERGITVATNPISNMKLANGFAPVPQLMHTGVKIAIGTDGAASNNTFNMFRELSAFSLVHKGTTGDPQIVSAQEALKAATFYGARALGLNSGEIRVGMNADLTIIDLDRPNMQPVNNPLSALCYSASGYETDTVLVGGKVLMEKGKLLTIDTGRIFSECARICERIGI